jgi:hypothetical protein
LKEKKQNQLSENIKQLAMPEATKNRRKIVKLIKVKKSVDSSRSNKKIKNELKPNTERLFHRNRWHGMSVLARYFKNMETSFRL